MSTALTECPICNSGALHPDWDKDVLVCSRCTAEYRVVGRGKAWVAVEQLTLSKTL